jgi:hypothetical protein
LLLLAQAAATWEAADRVGDRQSGWAAWAAQAFKVRANFFAVAAAVVKVAVTAAIFHGMLVLFGASGSSGPSGVLGSSSSFYSADVLTPLLWVWFFGVVTGHLVFGRMQQQEALDFLRVDMEEARATLAKAEAQADALAAEATQARAHAAAGRLINSSFSSSLFDETAAGCSLLEGSAGAEEWKSGVGEDGTEEPVGEDGYSEDSTEEGAVGSISEFDERS